MSGSVLFGRPPCHPFSAAKERDLHAQEGFTEAESTALGGLQFYEDVLPDGIVPPMDTRTQPCLCGGAITATDQMPDTVAQAVREHQGTLHHLAWRGHNGWPRPPLTPWQAQRARLKVAAA